VTASVVEFRVSFISVDPPCDDRVGALREWCRRLAEHGLTPLLGGEGRSLGNLSFRVVPGRPGFIITGSSLQSKGALTQSDFVEVVDCDPDLGVVFAAGARDPSSESFLHHAIYAQRQDVGAVFHGHDAEIVDNAARLGIPETAVPQPPRSLRLAREVAKILHQGDFLVMKEHGFLSLGRTMDEAGRLALAMKHRTNGRNAEG